MCADTTSGRMPAAASAAPAARVSGPPALAADAVAQPTSNSNHDVRAARRISKVILPLEPNAETFVTAGRPGTLRSHARRAQRPAGHLGLDEDPEQLVVE